LLEAGIDAKDISKWVTTNPDAIYEHYADKKRNISFLR
jgi:hypothetical protein